MTNSLSPISSTPVAGLGTQTYTCPTTGLYTLSCQSFLPYLAAGSPAISAVAANEVENITFTTDSSGSLNNTYFIVYGPGNLYGFYVWFNINSAGTDPAPTGGLQSAGALIGIQVAGATGALGSVLATAAIAAWNANATAAATFKASAGASAHMILTALQPGSCTAAADSVVPPSPSMTYSVTTAGSYGTPAQSGLNIVLNHGSTLLQAVGYPSPTQPLASAASTFSATALDTVTVVLSSLSTADAALNAVKSIINIYQGPAV